MLDIQNLTTRFTTEKGTVKAINDLSFSLQEGQTLGLVGESGSGKSVTALSIMRLILSPPGKITQGKIFFQGLKKSNMIKKKRARLLPDGTAYGSLGNLMKKLKRNKRRVLLKI